MSTGRTRRLADPTGAAKRVSPPPTFMSPGARKTQILILKGVLTAYMHQVHCNVMCRLLRRLSLARVVTRDAQVAWRKAESTLSLDLNDAVDVTPHILTWLNEWMSCSALAALSLHKSAAIQVANSGRQKWGGSGEEEARRPWISVSIGAG